MGFLELRQAPNFTAWVGFGALLLLRLVKTVECENRGTSNGQGANRQIEGEKTCTRPHYLNVEQRQTTQKDDSAEAAGKNRVASELVYRGNGRGGGLHQIRVDRDSATGAKREAR